jgi:hypothetical protein
VCAAAQRKLHTIQAPGSLAEVPAYVEKTTPIVDDELRKLRALERPADHDQVDAYLQSVEETLASAKAVGAAAAKGDEDEARAKGIETQRLTRDAAAQAEKLGADTCASQ